MNPTKKNTKEAARLKRINLALLALFGVVIGPGGLAFGLDFGKGALVGCLVVAINFYFSQYLVARLFVPGQARFPVVVFYIIKFGLSMALLLVSLLYFNVDLWGVMAGLSTLFVISLFANFLGSAPEPETEAEEKP